MKLLLALIAFTTINSCSGDYECRVPNSWQYESITYGLNGSIIDSTDIRVFVDSVATSEDSVHYYLSNQHVLTYLNCFFVKYGLVKNSSVIKILDLSNSANTYPLVTQSLDGEITEYSLTVDYDGEGIIDGVPVRIYTTPETLSKDGGTNYLAHKVYFSDSLGIVQISYFNTTGDLASKQSLKRVDFKK